MKPGIVIPTYWSTGTDLGTPGGVQCYDHAIPIDADKPDLEACLESLGQVQGLSAATVFLLVVAPPTVEERAVHRVADIVRRHAESLPQVVVVDSFKSMVTNSVLAPAMVPDLGEAVSLRGYGAIRNMGLIACCAFGCDVAIFLDDDEVVLDEDFLTNAVYGFGAQSRSGIPVMAKSGYFLDRRNSALADRRVIKFHDRFWAKRAGFNEWMTQALAGPRISRSPYMCGGCHALHAEAFTRVAFDPWITRGEDEDYLISLRMYGIDVWFDNRWRVRHLPPRGADTPARFQQDIYRWVYERRKIEACNSRIDLQKIVPDAFMPYPGPWISEELPGRIRKTAFLRAIMEPEHGAYWKIFRTALRGAETYADENSTRYLRLQEHWRDMTTLAWLNEEISRVMAGEGMLNAAIASRMAQRANTSGLAAMPVAPAAGAPAGQAAAPAGFASGVRAAGAARGVGAVGPGETAPAIEGAPIVGGSAYAGPVNAAGAAPAAGVPATAGPAPVSPAPAGPAPVSPAPAGPAAGDDETR